MQNAPTTELMLLPGLLCDQRLWMQQIAGLAHEACSRVVDLSAYRSIEAMADAVLEDAPREFALGGFSMGGCVALEVVARAPWRVRRLALLSTRAAGLLPAVRQHYEQIIAELETGRMEAYLADAFPKYVAPEKVHDESVRRTFLAMGRDLGSVVGVRQMRALLAYPGFHGELRSIACPTLLICGEQDQRTPADVHREMAAQIPTAHLKVIAGSGHFTPLEQPGAVTEALRRWLRMPAPLSVKL
jgi:pimeloyl-ACP methyl ester carboxylesterase